MDHLDKLEASGVVTIDRTAGGVVRVWLTREAWEWMNNVALSPAPPAPSPHQPHPHRNRNIKD